MFLHLILFLFDHISTDHTDSQSPSQNIEEQDMAEIIEFRDSQARLVIQLLLDINMHTVSQQMSPLNDRLFVFSNHGHKIGSTV